VKKSERGRGFRENGEINLFCGKKTSEVLLRIPILVEQFDK